ncbi:hypothetical protein [Red-eared slider ranavirus]|nr:hypothetical protein [Red-eared slider ranavirus]
MWIHSPVRNYIHLSHTILHYPYPGSANIIYNRGHLHSRGGRGRRVCHQFVVLGKALLFSADALSTRDRRALPCTTRSPLPWEPVRDSQSPAGATCPWEWEAGPACSLEGTRGSSPPCSTCFQWRSPCGCCACKTWNPLRLSWQRRKSPCWIQRQTCRVCRSWPGTGKSR